MNPLARDMLDHLLQAARAEPDPGKRRLLLDGAAQGIPRALYAPILNAVAAPEPDSLDLEIAHAIFLRWAWETPDFAGAWAAASPPGSFRNEALAEAAGRWAATSPEEAIRWARSLPPGDRRLVFGNAWRFMSRASASSAITWQLAAQSEP
jgi:hypothetical protein